jgi:hypothetical protein
MQAGAVALDSYRRNPTNDYGAGTIGAHTWRHNSAEPLCVTALQSQRYSNNAASAESRCRIDASRHGSPCLEDASEAG